MNSDPLVESKSPSPNLSRRTGRGTIQPFSRSQRFAIAVLAIGIAGYAITRRVVDRAYIADPQPVHPDREHELADKIDPNTADADTLAVLPLIGDKRAREIVAFRETYVAAHPGQVAFATPRDMLRIHGVGLTTLDQLAPFLIFPATSATMPTTKPAGEAE